MLIAWVRELEKSFDYLFIFMNMPAVKKNAGTLQTVVQGNMKDLMTNYPILRGNRIEALRNLISILLKLALLQSVQGIFLLLIILISTQHL